MNIIFTLSTLMALLCFGGFIWLQHEKNIRENKVHAPWKEAIKRNDWAACDHWNSVSKSYPLLGIRVVFNPIAWVRYWNWNPPQSKEQ
jgi:hypothetical protein